MRHCLEKSPEARFQAASDIAFDLEAMSAAPLTSGSQPLSTPKARRLLAPVAAVAVVLAAFAAGHFLWRSAAPSLPSFKRITFRRGNLANARFTPDGNSVVYAASWDGKPLEIFSVRLDGVESTPLGLRNADVMSVSRSGELAISIRETFLGGPEGIGTLARVPVSGGVPRDVLQLVHSADWGPDGNNMAIIRGESGKVQLEYPIGTVRYTTSNGLAHPRFSPDGNQIAVLEISSQGYAIVVLNLRGGVQRLAERIDLIGRLAWAPHGREIWFDDFKGRGQSAISAIDLAGRRRVVAQIPTSLTLFDITANGKVLLERATVTNGVIYQGSGSPRESDLGWFDSSFPAAISPSGDLLLMQVWGDAGGPSGAFYLRKTDGSPPVKLGDGIAFALSPDARMVLAKLDRNEFLSLVPIGPGSPVPVARGDLKIIEDGAFLPGGTRLLVVARESEKAPRLLYVQESPTGKPRAIAPVELYWPRPSPDGRFVVASHDFNEDWYVLPIDGGEQRRVPEHESTGARRLDVGRRFHFRERSREHTVAGVQGECRDGSAGLLGRARAGRTHRIDRSRLAADDTRRKILRVRVPALG